MAIALVGTPVVGNDPASGTTLASPALSTTTGNSLLVGCLSQQGDFVGTTITGVTDTAGNTYTALTMQGSAGAGAQILRWFYCHNITGNASNVATGTWSASTATRHIIQIEFSGAKNQAPISEGGNAVLGVSSCPVNIAMGSTVGAVFSMATSSNDRTWTPGTGFTEINDWGSSAAADYYTGFNATGTVTADMTPSAATNFSLVAVGFEQAAVGPTINTNPSDQTVFDGGSATFSVSATTSGGSLSYQWQDNSGGSFANIGGATSASLTVLASLSMNRRLYRVNVTDSNGTTTSSSATLFVRSITAFWPPRPITQPPFRRAKSTLWLLDPSNWGGASLNVGKWFADEMPTGAASPNVTKALTGVSATGQVGTVVSNVSYAITGNQASGQVGTVTNAASYALTGNAATGQVGTVVSNVTYGLTGVQATGQVGTVSYANDITLALTGVSATGQVGTLIPNVAYALTGNQATGQVGTVTSAVTYALTGIAATGNVGAVVSNITYGLTGNQATGQVGAVSAGNDVTFSLTGVQATGNVGAVTPNITYALTGVQASGQVGSVTASPSYGLTGNQATGQVGTLTSAVAYGLTGVEGAGQVGNVSIPGDVTIALTGVQATGYVGDLLLQIASNVPAGGSGGYEHEAAIIRYRRAVARRQQEAEIAAKAKAEADEAQQRLNIANTKRQREKEARIIEKLRRQEDEARTLEEQLMVEIELLQKAILGANVAAQQTAMQAEEEEFALMFALTTLI